MSESVCVSDGREEVHRGKRKKVRKTWRFTPAPQGRNHFRAARDGYGRVDWRRGPLSRLSFFIMLAGWTGFGVYVFLFVEFNSPSVFVEHFLNPDHEGIRFRALVFFAPLISTVVGYLVNEREKLMLKTLASGRKVSELSEELTACEERMEAYSVTDEILESAPFGIFIIGADGTIEYVNPVMLEICGARKENLVGGNVFDIPTYEEAGLMEKIKAVLRGESFRLGPMAYTSHSGNKKTIRQFTGIPYQRGGESKALVFVEDLTEQKRAEKALSDLLSQRELFISRMGHDLKTPLTPLVTLLPLIRKQVHDERLGVLLDVVVQDVGVIKELVIKALKHARISSYTRTLKMESLALAREVEGYVGKREYLLDKGGISVENSIGAEVAVHADPVELEELFYNIISNAIKYTPPGGAITMGAEEGEDRVTVSVRDTGAGLTEEEIEKIFDEFYKVDESRHDLDTSGLGLSICRKIAEKHGGRIWAESLGKGRGTTVFFTLPVPQEDEKEV
jgi:PAS domain S-box-containing protein